MDSIIPLGQKNTLAEYMLLSGADNHPPMLDKDLYDSWKSIMELYMKNKEQERMKLESVENGPLIWPTVEENGSAYNNPQLQQQFPPSQYGSIHPTQRYSSTYPSQPQFNHSSIPPSYPYQSQMNHQTSYVKSKLLIYTSSSYTTMTELPLRSVIASSRFPSTNNQLRISSNLRNQATIQDGRVTMQQVQEIQGEEHMARQCTQPKRPRNASWYKDKAILAEAKEAGQILDKEQLAFFTDPGIPDGQAIQTIIPHNVAFQTEDLDTYDSDCDDISNAKAVLMALISNYGSDVISEVPHSETYPNDMENQSVHAMQDFKQSPVMDFTDNEIHSYQNSFYLKKAQRIKPTLYDGIVISDKHVVVPVIDDEETLILEEVSRSKMSEKGKDPEAIKQNISHKPIDYVKLNQLSKDFGKRFTPQQELSAEQAFWFRISNPTMNLLINHLSKWKFPVNYLRNKLELLVYVQDTCPNAIKLSAKKVVVTPKTKIKKVRFAKPLTSSSNIKQLGSSTTSDSNTLVLSPTRLKCSTNNCGSKPTSNKKNDRISQTPSRNMKNKVEAQPRKVNKKNHVVEPIRDVDVKHSMLNANSKLIYATCNKSCPDCSLVSGLQMFETYDREPLSAHELFQEAAAPRAVVLADSPMSTSIDQDAPSTSISSTQEKEHSPNISQSFEESPKTPTFRDDPLHESLYEDSTSQGSSSNLRQTHTPFKYLGRWTKDHPIANVVTDIH
ncbi:hypothetical protein Tco_1057344 [Tanacetum coccineum]|uniref:Uncharacterized protein n=1 Tax=Tanacetum coccineum TaxID=301880 RepID=A0ABQ5H6X6_9ASTR